MKIKWPVILKLNNEDTMFYIENLQDYIEHLQNCYLTDPDYDLLIDMDGNIYSISEAAITTPAQANFKKQMELSTFNQLVRNHLSAQQQCCVLKIEITTFLQGFELVKNTAEDQA